MQTLALDECCCAGCTNLRLERCVSVGRSRVFYTADTTTLQGGGFQTLEKASWRLWAQRTVPHPGLYVLKRKGGRSCQQTASQLHHIRWLSVVVGSRSVAGRQESECPTIAKPERKTNNIPWVHTYSVQTAQIMHKSCRAAQGTGANTNSTPW